MASLPRDFSTLGARLDDWTPPESPFDPVGAWTLRYARHALIPKRDGAPGGGRAGVLTVAQRPAANGFHLQTSETVAAGFSSPTTAAESDCASDALLTPQRWSLEVRWLSGPQANIKPGEIDQTRSGRAEGRELIFTSPGSGSPTSARRPSRSAAA